MLSKEKNHENLKCEVEFVKICNFDYWAGLQPGPLPTAVLFRAQLV